MKFVSSRELRINPGTVWKRLRHEKDLVITSSGKPVAVLTFAEEDSLENVLATLRQGRAQAATVHIRRVAIVRGVNRLTDKGIQEIIRRSRTGGRKVASGGKH